MHWHVQLSGKHEIRSVHFRAWKFFLLCSRYAELALAGVAFRPEADREGLMNNLRAKTRNGWKLWKLGELEQQPAFKRAFSG